MKRNLEQYDVFENTKPQKYNQRVFLPAGTFVVTATAFDGGGTGHGPHDVYPDGHHVFCKKIDRDTGKVGTKTYDFYQTGFFCDMIKKTHVELIGKAKVTFTI